MRALMALLVTIHLPAADVIDRIVAIVGKRAIKSSDIDRDIKITAFLNQETPAFDFASRKKSLERLIDQAIIRDQIERGGYRLPIPEDADALLKQVRADRFGGSSERMDKELARYGLTEHKLRDQLLWQLKVLRFIDQRFRPGVVVNDEQVKAYYDQNRSSFSDQSFDAVEEKIRESMEAERVDKAFDQWLKDTRKRFEVEYVQESFK